MPCAKTFDYRPHISSKDWNLSTGVPYITDNIFSGLAYKRPSTGV